MPKQEEEWQLQEGARRTAAGVAEKQVNIPPGIVLQPQIQK